MKPISETLLDVSGCILEELAIFRNIPTLGIKNKYKTLLKIQVR